MLNDNEKLVIKYIMVIDKNLLNKLIINKNNG